MDKDINGICCEVENCVHHDMSNTCSAGHITICTCSSNNSAEAKCETFESCKNGDCSK